ncbi:glutaredoxin, partial [Escherichia coli]
GGFPMGGRFFFFFFFESPDLLGELAKIAHWPALPQMWVDGGLGGGCDIVIEMYQRGELQQLIKETAAKYKSEEPDAE